MSGGVLHGIVTIVTLMIIINYINKLISSI
jgi:hypothetical protein